MSYCNYCKDLPDDNVHAIYHKKHYGFPIVDNRELFERLCLEINQAGLSWNTILIKQQNFKEAFDNFDFRRIAKYDSAKKEELLQNKGIIRNRLKIEAVIYNAKIFEEIIENHGNFVNWLDFCGTNDLEQWVKIFKKNFKFVGKEIVNEFLMSIGYLPGAHLDTCPIYKNVINNNPVWLK